MFELCELEETWAYDFFCGLSLFLKNFEISLTSLGIFAGIGGGRGDIKNERSGLSLFSIFLSHSYFLFDLFSIILFLELGLGLEWQDHAVTQQVTSDDMVTNHIM